MVHYMSVSFFSFVVSSFPNLFPLCVLCASSEAGGYLLFLSYRISTTGASFAHRS